MSIFKVMFDPMALKMPDLKREEIDVALQRHCQYVDGAAFVGTATVGALLARKFFASRASAKTSSKFLFILGTSFIFSMVGTQWSVNYCFKKVLSTPESKVGQRLRELLILRGETPAKTTLLATLVAGGDPTDTRSVQDILREHSNAASGAVPASTAPNPVAANHVVAAHTQHAPVVEPHEPPRPLITPQNLHANPVWQSILSHEYVPVPVDNEARRATAEAVHQLPPTRHGHVQLK